MMAGLRVMMAGKNKIDKVRSCFWVYCGVVWFRAVEYGTFCSLDGLIH